METALITGASSGIGLEMAKELARRKINLVLIARNEVALVRIKQDLESANGVSVDILAVDLSTPQLFIT
jgi:short-subunit dehydrogenase